MNLSIMHPVDLNVETDKHKLVLLEHEYNTNEGSEFLDDAIRMQEQPLIYSKEGIGGGKSRNLL
jgi:hypothetical protein